MMDEGRKRVIGIMAAILTSLHMQNADDLFGNPQGSPRTDKLIAASVQWAVLIMKHARYYWLLLAEGHLHRGCLARCSGESRRCPCRAGSTAIAVANSGAEEGRSSVRENDCTAVSGVCQTVKTSGRNTAELVGARPSGNFVVVEGRRSV
jgi:hypothetical protein